MNNPDVIVVEWYDCDGKYHSDFIVRMGCKQYQSFDVTYVHKWENTREGMAHFLEHLPLIDVTIHLQND